ncbi:MAG: hypothetical protein HYY28_02170 [Betaproteobacteria bacterium]|nr:hypothetical protein [Betaproteobacteria bacterium]MBI2959093.1 hypothetical protein [Betaproteobacteria bacterium]
MKFRTVGMLAILLAACWPVQAQQQQGGQRGGQAAPPGWFAPPRGASGAPERAREHERMSPEERRQLRRDVTQHGREVYRERPERGGSEKRGRR